jgi:Lipoprotein LpqB beta-propeller domain/Sporulation and spore germination
MARERRGGIWPGWPAAVALAAFAVVLSGCATAPATGAPRKLQGDTGQQQAFVQPLPPPPPQPQWTPEEVVLGFLAAGASFELDPAAAQAYLAPGVRWNRSGPVTVVGTNINATPHYLSRLPNASYATVALSGQVLASLNSSGQYVYQPAVTKRYQFTLVRVDGIWKIEHLPQGTGLLLTQATFQQVFEPRDLYFFRQTASSPPYLVPDPVYAPLQGQTNATETDLARGLVRGLLNDKASWLSEATWTAFPPDTTLCESCVTVSNQTAVVDLGGAAARSSLNQLREMYAQLSWTLTKASYLGPVVQTVVLEVDGKVRDARGSAATVPAVGAATEPLYYGAAGLASLVPAGSLVPGRVPLPAVLAGRPDITAVAVSRGSRPLLAVAVPNAAGCAVYVTVPGRTSGYAVYRLTRKGGVCTSLSFDSGQNLLAVAGSGIWMLRPDHSAVTVGLRRASPLLPAGSRVLSLRMAPDGVRVALLVHIPGQSGNELLLAAIAYGSGGNGVSLGQQVPVGTDLTNVTAMSWYTPDELLALDGSTGLFEVPLTGGTSTQVSTLPYPASAIATTGVNNTIAIRTIGGEIYTSSAPVGPWSLVKAGSVPLEAGPAYPG